MIDSGLTRTVAESGTEAFGASIARSLHVLPVSISLSGALGSGKTALMRGFLRACGVTDAITSPTYALEQRYNGSYGNVLHLDLYRLTPAEADALLRHSDDHDGIRCVEWPERANNFHANIAIRIDESGPTQRTIAVDCSDVSWPEDATIDAWRRELALPANVSAHCDAVAAFCATAADVLLERGTFVRKAFVRAAGKVHDLFRFVDFTPGAAPDGHVDPPDAVATWERWKKMYPFDSHERAVEAFLIDQGFPELGKLAASHHIRASVDSRTTTEAHLLYYADKRFVGSRCVTIAERYDDFAQRYGNGMRSPESIQWERDALSTETLLFPDGFTP